MKQFDRAANVSDLVEAPEIKRALLAIDNETAGTASLGRLRILDDGSIDLVIWADTDLHAHEVTQKLHRRAQLPLDLPVYTLPTVYVGGDFDRIPEHCAPGKLGRVIVALG